MNYIISFRKAKVLMLIGSLAFVLACTEKANDITSKFEPVLTVSLKENPTLNSIANLSLIGTFQSNDTNYFALYDRVIGTIHYFDQATGKVVESFIVPINDSINFFPAMISVYGCDNILYFNTENQTLVKANRKQIKTEKHIKVHTGEVTWRVENSYTNLKFDTAGTKIIFTNWARYADGENGDSLMDERFLYVLLDTSTFQYEFIPIKPKYKRFTGEKERIYDIMPYAIHDKSGRYIGFNSFLNEIMIFKEGSFSESSVTGTVHPIEQVYILRGESTENFLDHFIGKRAHRLLYSSKHDSFIRRIKKWEKNGTRDVNTYTVEVLNSQFEVKNTFEQGNVTPVFYQYGDNIYLKIMNRDTQILTYYVFTN